MRKLELLFVLVLLILFQSLVSAQNVSPQFSELKGMEDAQGNTHLFYRIYSYEEIQPFGFYEDNSLYHLDIYDQMDTLFIRESGSDISAHIYLNDYKIINFNPMHFIYAGTACGYECSPFAYNSNYGFIFDDGSWGNSFKIGNGQNPDLIYYGLSAWIMDSTITTLLSNDGGLNWDTLSSSKIFLSINPYENQTSFYSGNLDSKVYKSSNGGINFYISDTTQNYIYFGLPDFYYDINQNHIYRNSIRGNTDYPYYLAVSSNNGEPFSWSNKYFSNNPIFFSNDTSQSGAIYLADGKRIFFSADYGSTFNLYKELDNRIVGIYKKPNSDKLYAATKYNLYEITNDSITIIKSLPISEELLAYYPLSVGNYWIYKMEIWDSWPIISYSEDTFTRKVVSKETLSNNKEYFKIEETYHGSAYTNYVYERVDSANGLVYRFDNECSNPDSEKVIDNLTSEQGDSLLIQRYTMCWDSILTLFSAAGSESIFNENRNYRLFEYNWLMSYNYKLAQGLGIHNIRWGYDFGSTDFLLKGCVIDEIIYGDTTLTDIADENELPKEFSLSQNYPNPFNPSTVISYQLPIAGEVTLKVFDILGNEVVTLVDEYRAAGSHEVEFNSSTIKHYPSSGVYFYQLKAGSFVETKKMVLIK